MEINEITFNCYKFEDDDLKQAKRLWAVSAVALPIFFAFAAFVIMAAASPHSLAGHLLGHVTSGDIVVGGGSAIVVPALALCAAHKRVQFVQAWLDKREVKAFIVNLERIDNEGGYHVS